MADVMLRRLCFVAAAAALMLCDPVEVLAFDHAQVARRSMAGHIVPRYQTFTVSAMKLAHKTSAYCAEATGTTLADVRRAFRAAVVAWGGVAHVRFGPVAKDNRYERILFWPDPRRVTAKQVGRTLRKMPVDVLQPEFLSSTSVAMIGLRSLELVLFGRGSERLETLLSDASRFRCSFAVALARAMHAAGAEVLAEWADENGFQKLWLYPGSDNRRYLKPSEPTQALVQSFTDRIDRLVAFDLPAPAEGGDQQSGEPLFAMSGSTAAYLKASLDTLEELLRLGGFIDQASIDGAVAGEDIRQRLQAIITELQFARRALGIVAQSADEPRGLARISAAQWQAVRLPLQNARHLADETLKAQAGLSSGFNAMDGD